MPEPKLSQTHDTAKSPVNFVTVSLSVGTICLTVFGWHSWPFCCVCLSPMMSLGRWIATEPRTVSPRTKLTRFIALVVGNGFFVAWWRSGFITTAIPEYGLAIRCAACLVFSLHFAVIGFSVYWCRHRSLAISAIACVTAAICSEVFQAWLGFAWSLTNLAFGVLDTPIAQWSSLLTPFGVAGIVYGVNFLFAVDPGSGGFRAWQGPILSMIILATAWTGGLLLKSSVKMQTISFTAMLVQPHLHGNAAIPWTPWVTLDELTRRSLVDAGPVDLIVWPESSLSESFSMAQVELGGESATRLSLQQFAHRFQPFYGTTCLVGVGILRTETEVKYGYEVQVIRRLNCGCLVTASDKVNCHEKSVLVPFKERELGWMQQPEIRRWLPNELKLQSQFTAGASFRVLPFVDRDGVRRTIAVSVCYESFFPWLPQYHTATPVDAIIHILYDGDSIDDPSLLQRHINACRYRAIETRKWNLVCSTWAGTSVIDPTGRIVRQLPPIAGVLRTDTF